MLMPALRLFALRGISFDEYRFPRWQSAVAILVLGIVIGLDPSLRTPRPGVLPMPFAVALAYGVVSTAAGFLIVVTVLKWWLRRGQRWDGNGDLVNLSAASWLVPDLLIAGLTTMGVPGLLTLPLWLYSAWVGANAIAGAIPRVTLGYAIAGIAIGMIPAILAMILIAFAATVVPAALGFQA
ncbi:hypothetical protein [Noviherbaspirillum aridicola]|uniref:Yip1 domain-containing protein n=1 Tax=Noviherbaspirillum aridicola TaxID=2849687 RepID=A0ABQ4QA93_9BURK|nr:hypothetical protein [Noviherbaspirillum aridicola]GIZ54128.1 hypothetical protein NCCP691_41420 [Noviherbaspirillum aridicola]